MKNKNKKYCYCASKYNDKFYHTVHFKVINTLFEVSNVFSGVLNIFRKNVFEISALATK